jgi:hypothetical protein
VWIVGVVVVAAASPPSILIHVSVVTSIIFNNRL